MLPGCISLPHSLLQCRMCLCPSYTPILCCRNPLPSLSSASASPAAAGERAAMGPGGHPAQLPCGGLEWRKGMYLGGQQEEFCMKGNIRTQTDDLDGPCGHLLCFNHRVLRQMFSIMKALIQTIHSAYA